MDGRPVHSGDDRTRLTGRLVRRLSGELRMARGRTHPGSQIGGGRRRDALEVRSYDAARRSRHVIAGQVETQSRRWHHLSRLLRSVVGRPAGWRSNTRGVHHEAGYLCGRGGRFMAGAGTGLLGELGHRVASLGGPFRPGLRPLGAPWVDLDNSFAVNGGSGRAFATKAGALAWRDTGRAGGSPRSRSRLTSSPVIGGNGGSGRNSLGGVVVGLSDAGNFVGCASR